MMENYITDERTGLKYELVGDYYLIAGDDEPEEERPIGIWGQRHLRYLKEHHRVRYANLLTSGELNAYLADIDRQAEELFLRLVKQMADAEGISLRRSLSQIFLHLFMRQISKRRRFLIHHQGDGVQWHLIIAHVHDARTHRDERTVLFMLATINDAIAKLVGAPLDMKRRREQQMLLLDIHICSQYGLRPQQNSMPAYWLIEADNGLIIINVFLHTRTNWLMYLINLNL